MEIFKTIITETEIKSDILCDVCEQSVKTEYGLEYMELKACWGYITNHDLETWTAQICEKCVEEKLGFVKFKKERTQF